MDSFYLQDGRRYRLLGGGIAAPLPVLRLGFIVLVHFIPAQQPFTFKSDTVKEKRRSRTVWVGSKVRTAPLWAVAGPQNEGYPTQRSPVPLKVFPASVAGSGVRLWAPGEDETENRPVLTSLFGVAGIGVSEGERKRAITRVTSGRRSAPRGDGWGGGVPPGKDL